MKRPFSFLKPGCYLFLAFLVSSCQKYELNDIKTSGKTKASITSLNILFYALDGGSKLDKINTSSPQTILSSVPISGLQSSEKILAIDFRPATGQLYGLGSTSRLYVINPETGTARMIGAAPITPALDGPMTGFDFNPTVDRLRIVSNKGLNLRVNPETAIAIEDGRINGQANAAVTAVAYRNSFAGAATTTLYDIDVTSKKLFKQNPANSGTLVEVGQNGLQLNIAGEGGFDISAKEGVALGLFDVSGRATLFNVDTITGKALVLTQYPKSKLYTGLAIPTQPVAYAINAMNSFIIFNPETPMSLMSRSIIGLSPGERISGLDFRPLNGQLYALGNQSNVYTINASSGAATLVTKLSINLSGATFGFDFNPIVDRIRIISSNGQNLRFNPNDGTVVKDSMLNFSDNPAIPATGVGAAYANNFAGTTATTLFVIDNAKNALYKQDPPNLGTLTKIGNLGVDIFKTGGFDIGGTSNKAYAILTNSDNVAKFYSINTSTGAATAISDFISEVRGLAIGLGF